ncbi:hypothetical protein [Candidatus Palauibacter sp.]|uniref:hypothetical protein n=1 Tax=Candidatus Palauibacter sp. TaxID=3101350 RepID=UPI003AF22B72
MRRVPQSASVIVLSIISTMLAMPGNVAGQKCDWSGSAWLSIPATTVLRVERHNTDLTLGWLGRLGHTCGSGTRRHGFDADAQRVYGFGGMYVFSLMGRLGHMYRFDADPRAPWVEIAANAGFFYAFDPTDYVELLIVDRPEQIPGRTIDLPGAGLAAGGDLRVGFPASPFGSFVLDFGLRAHYMPSTSSMRAFTSRCAVSSIVG